MLKLKVQYFGHLMQRADLLEKILMLEKIESRRMRGRQRMRWLVSITDMNLSKLLEVMEDRGAWLATVHGVARTSLVAQRICLRSGRSGFEPWVGKIPWRRAQQPTLVFLPRILVHGESPWTKEPGRLQSIGPQRVRHDWATKHRKWSCKVLDLTLPWNNNNQHGTLVWQITWNNILYLMILMRNYN